MGGGKWKLTRTRPSRCSAGESTTAGCAAALSYSTTINGCTGMDCNKDVAAMVRIMEAVQFASIMCGPEKPWGAVLKLYPASDGTLAVETVDGVRIMRGFRANDGGEGQ